MASLRSLLGLGPLLLFICAACTAPAQQPDAASDVGTADVAPEADTPDQSGALGDAQVAFDFGDWTIPPAGEQYPCAQWTLNNDKPLYVNAVTQANDGGFHHSNWYAVRDDQFAGPDGFFNCDDYGFDERQGAAYGDVVFAQSTQAYVETQRLPQGVVIKIPPRSKIIGGVHLLNVSNSPLPTGVRMGLELVHPKDVEVVATPWRVDNSELAIPGGGQHTRWATSCNLADQYEFKADEPFEPVLYWILPHYHALGDYFRVDLIKPDGDETILELSGFNAEANGVVFPEPISLAGSTGLRMVCGYTNPADRTVFYGVEGTDEMCTLLAFTNAKFRLNTQVWEEAAVDEAEGPGIETHHGECSALFIPKNDGQSPPTQEEIDAPLYVPASNTDGVPVTVVPECEDTPVGAEPSGPITLSSLRVDIFAASCAYSSCHDADAPAGGLDFTAENLHAEILGHELLTAAAMPLVTPGDAARSWLFNVISTCRPPTENGVAVPMPRNSPRLLPPGEVARVRAWIDAGALDD